MISRLPARGRVWAASVLLLLVLFGFSVFWLQERPGPSGSQGNTPTPATWTTARIALNTADNSTWRNGTIALGPGNTTVELDTPGGLITLDTGNSTFVLSSTIGNYSTLDETGTFVLAPATGTYQLDAANDTIVLQATNGNIALGGDSAPRTPGPTTLTASPGGRPQLPPFALLLVSSAFLGLLTFARIRHDSLLKNVVRHRIHEYIKANPGKHYRAILKTLGLAMGVLTYHLNTLEKGGYITSRQDGAKRRFFPAGARAEMRFFLSELQERIVAAIQQSSGISQAGIAEALNVSRPLVNYHVHILRDAGLVRLEPRGRETGCFLTASPPPTSPAA